MKKFIYTLCFALSLITIKAQYWNTSLNASSTIKLGTSSNDPLNFYTNNRKFMSLSTHGILKLDSAAGTGDRVVMVDQDGNFRFIPSGYVYPGSPCLTSAMPWSMGGNIASSSTNRAGTCNNYDYVLKSNDKESIFLKTNGYVGIGLNNSNPVAPFDITDGNTTGNTHHLRFYADSMGTIEATRNMNLNYNPGSAFSINEGTSAGGVNKFYIQGNQSWLLTALDISSNLNVNGNVSAAGMMRSSSATATNVAFVAYNPSTNKNNFWVYSGGKTQIGAQTNATNAGMLNINMNSSGTGSAADNAFDIYDQSTQKVNFRVKASGFAYAKELNIQLNTFPDYVFAEGYKLQSLESLETYIKANKHLPNVPTAKEVEKDGANLGELAKIQMEKIEELTLYLIELKKEVDVLKKQVNNK